MFMGFCELSCGKCWNCNDFILHFVSIEILLINYFERESLFFAFNFHTNVTKFTFLN